jgi:alkylhydroperoxidase family enzyme
MTNRPVRIPPQPPEEWSEATRRALGDVVEVGGVSRPIHLPSVIAHHPTYLAPYLGWAKAIALHGVLSPRHNEILALRTAYLCQSDFEWGAHTRYALGRGCLTDDEIGAVALGPRATLWDPIERTMLHAADELHENASIGEATWIQLAAEFDHDAILEVVFIVGHYTMLSMVANTAGVQPESGWPAVPG